MKDNKNIVICCASWEERFLLGFERLIENFPVKIIYMFYYKEYAGASHNNRNTVKERCRGSGIKCNEYEVSFDEPVESYKIIYSKLFDKELDGENVIVNISTMPREIIWTIFDLIEEVGARVKYLYDKPVGYNEDWLSRDPDRPRLVFKLGGEAKLGALTALLILPGYDPDRTEQLIHFFEPSECIIGLQVGGSLRGEQNIKEHKDRFSEIPGIKFFDIDAYSADHGFGAIEKEILPFIAKSNIIMTSLGPKLSAVALYRLHKKFPQTALVYAPAKEFNINYSHGMAEFIEGEL